MKFYKKQLSNKIMGPAKIFCVKTLLLNAFQKMCSRFSFLNLFIQNLVQSLSFPMRIISEGFTFCL